VESKENSDELEGLVERCNEEGNREMKDGDG
jgi:hypothetical protein